MDALDTVVRGPQDLYRTSGGVVAQGGDRLEHRAQRAGIAIEQSVDANWRVPARVELSEGFVLWHDRGGRGRDVTHTDPNFLVGFANLADGKDSAIRAFARRWGPLRLCKDHGLPSTHTQVHLALRSGPWPGQPELCAPQRKHHDGEDFHAEPVQAWRNYAAQVGALIDVASHLHRREEVSLDLWRALDDLLPKVFGVPKYEGLTRGRRIPESALPKTGVIAEPFVTFRDPTRFSLLVRQYLELGAVRVMFDWTDAGPILEFGSRTMFGGLALALALAVSQNGPIYTCSGCSTVYVRHKRAPAKGKRNFCPACDTGVKNTLSTKDWRARQHGDE